MSNQPDLIGLRIGEFQQKNEDAEKLCKKSRDSCLISTEQNRTTQPTQRPNIYKGYMSEKELACDRSCGKRAWLRN